jgi:hypothetical protein
MADDVGISETGALINRRTSLALRFVGNSAGSAARAAGAAELPNGIRTHNEPHVLGTTLFGGIEGELIDVGASAMHGDANTAVSVADGLYRLQFPNAVTSSIYYTMTVPEWWLAGEMNVLWDLINDHSDATGNVRMTYTVKEIDLAIGGDTPATARTVTATVSHGVPNAGTLTTGIICGADPAGFFPWSGMTAFQFVPATAGSIYALQITRIGGDAADTFGGSIGIVDLAWGRIPAS